MKRWMWIYTSSSHRITIDQIAEIFKVCAETLNNHHGGRTAMPFYQA